MAYAIQPAKGFFGTLYLFTSQKQYFVISFIPLCQNNFQGKIDDLPKITPHTFAIILLQTLATTRNLREREKKKEIKKGENRPSPTASVTCISTSHEISCQHPVPGCWLHPYILGLVVPGSIHLTSIEADLPAVPT